MLSSLIPSLSGARMTLEKHEGGPSVLKSPCPSEQKCALSGAQGDDKHGLFESSEDDKSLPALGAERKGA